MKYLALLILFVSTLSFGQLRVPTSGLGFPNTSDAPTKQGVCQLVNSQNFLECFGYDDVLHTFPDTNYIPDQLKANSSICIGASCPVSCGAATNCESTFLSSTNGTPTSGEAYCYNTASGRVCSFNGAPEVTLMTNKSNSVNHTVCWKTSTQLGYCSSVVASDGTCTCN